MSEHVIYCVTGTPQLLSSHLIYILQQTYKLGIFISILQMRRLRLRAVKQLAIGP